MRAKKRQERAKEKKERRRDREREKERTDNTCCLVRTKKQTTKNKKK